MVDKKKVPIEPYWLSFGNAAKSCRVSPNTFRSWGIEPIYVNGRTKYFTVENIILSKAEFDKKIGSVGSVGSVPVINEDGEIVEYAKELALKTQQERIRLELSNLEKTGELVPVGLFVDAVILISNHWGASLDSMVLDIKRQVPDIKNSALEIIERLRIGMQNELADWELGTKNSIEDLQKGSVDDTKNRASNGQ